MIYIALLRGINVGGKNKIKMGELRDVLETMGLNRVQTYIQSGNILFESNEKEEPLQKQIEKKIEEGFGYSINVILRTPTELERIIGNCPFSEKAISEAEASAVGESLYVALLSKPPSQEGIKRLSNYKNEKVIYLIEGREIYLLFHHSIKNSNLARSLQKLGVPVTIRNWKTLNKLDAMVNERNT
ncbi:Uncharacterized conserved protein, DUF1697 family [Virgibacillus subterraneus]|uniref:Uncharacterized conserved protein, DUF1697 family n=1 Tax=Virgibacillus subterraneus TaxID=621109 RepID=A0A1H9GE80_9BACI|nr:DUF1697 domain-containing protein [Virgibacillus subterraneus]SEQ48377.1 Uncharacterized conserved protein, DUF1697 family [Virgibacillus subterraneus]